MQGINQEIVSFLQEYDVNFTTTQQELGLAQGDLKKFQILFTAMAKVVEDSVNTAVLEKAMSLAEKAETSSGLDPRCLTTITQTFERIVSKIDQNQQFDKLLNSWDAPEKVKCKVRECRQSNSSTLELREYRLSSFPSTLLEYLPHVNILDLSENRLTSFSLKGAPQLKALILRTNELTSLELEEPSQLEELDVSWNRLTSFSLEGASQLKVLHIYHNNLESFTLKEAPDLEDLNLSNNKLTSFMLEKALSLKILHLSNNNLTLFTLEGALALKALYLSKNQLKEGYQLINCATPQTLDL